MDAIYVRCRTCGHVAYRRGPCPYCKILGKPWEPTDVVELLAYGTKARLERDLARARKEAAALREAYKMAAASNETLLRKQLRVQTVIAGMKRWEKQSARLRELV